MNRILIVARNKNFPSIGMREAFSIHKDILQRMETPATENPQDTIPKTIVKDLKSLGVTKVHTDGTWRSDGGHHVAEPHHVNPPIAGTVLSNAVPAPQGVE